MMHLNILNTREIKEIKEKLEEQYGFSGNLGMAFLKSNKGKIYIVSRDISRIKFEELNIDSIGMYFASEDSGGNLRLSIEGSQLIGLKATKNIHDIDDGLFKLWIAGHDIPLKQEKSPFLLIRHRDDFVGTGKVIGGKLRNFNPKSRRITTQL